MLTDLKSCPFCGSRTIVDYTTDRGWQTVGCADCNCEAPFADTLEAVIAAWNQRHVAAEPDPLAAKRMRVLEALLSVGTQWAAKFAGACLHITDQNPEPCGTCGRCRARKHCEDVAALHVAAADTQPAAGPSSEIGGVAG